ncbi:hypothetical protein N2152v2_000843 [Parachlorella kessleri]
MAQYKPLVDQEAAQQMNLTVLRRLDPAVDELLATAGHVALYDFDIPTKRWSRKDVEGSLFLVKRRAQPRFQFIILNKKSADNFVEDVMGNFQCEVNKPYLLYRNKNSEVVGIWFYDDDECDRISALLQRIATTFAAPASATIGMEANGNASGITSAASASSTPAKQTPPTAAPPAGTAGPAGLAGPQHPQQAPQVAQRSRQQQGAGGSRAQGGSAGGPPAEGGAAGGAVDDGFWDKQVEVPADVELPHASQAHNGMAPAFPRSQQQQQQQQGEVTSSRAGNASSPARPPPASDNSLLRIFAGMKLSPPVGQGQHARPGAPAGASPSVLPLLSPTAASQLPLPPPAAPADGQLVQPQAAQQAQQGLNGLPPIITTPGARAPAAPAAGPPPAAVTPLLTPQFLKQQAAAAPLPASPARETAAAVIQSAGQALLKQLQGRPPSQPATLGMPPTAAPAPADAAAPDAGEGASSQATDNVQQAAKVRAFMRALAENDAVVELVAAELRKADLL